MQKQFVTYEIALKLKELVFDEECLARFEEDNYLHIVTSNNIGRRKFIQVPIWQQVFDWLDLKRCHITINYLGCESYEWKINYIGKQYSNSMIYETRYLAREQAVLKAIEILTEQNQYK